ARTEAASDRNRRALRDVIGAERLGGRFRRGASRYDEQVVVAGGNAVPVLMRGVAVEGHRPRSCGPEIELGEKREGDRERIEAGTKIRARSGHPHTKLPHARTSTPPGPR